MAILNVEVMTSRKITIQCDRCGKREELHLVGRISIQDFIQSQGWQTNWDTFHDLCPTCKELLQ